MHTHNKYNVICMEKENSAEKNKNNVQSEVLCD